MARTADYLPADIVDIEFDTDTREEKTEAETKTDAFAEALKSDSEAFINVSRQIMGGNSPMEFVARFPADKYDYGQLQVYLQQKYGPGDYRLMLYANGKVRQNKLLTIASPMSPEKTSSVPVSSEVGAILSNIMDRFERQNAIMTQLLQGGRQTEDDFLDKMLKYKQLFGSDSGSNNGLSQLKDSIEVLQNLGVNIGGDSDNEPGFGGLLEKMVPVFEAAAKGSKQPTLKTNPSPRANKDMLQNLMIKNGVAMMLKAAAKKASPVSYAEMVFDQVPEKIIREYMAGPMAIEKLALIDQRVMQYREWFEELGEHVKAQLGMPSKVSHLYEGADDLQEAPDGAITPENAPQADSDNVDTPDVSVE